MIFGGEGARQLALAVRSCTKSLERFKLSTLQNQIGNVVEIITALMVHPQLKQLDLGWMNIGRNECAPLATLLHNTEKLRTLNLINNDIDDECVEVLTSAISGSNLVNLILSNNGLITARGWTTLSALLEMPNSKLEELSREQHWQ